jgi:hypothetical protein
MRRTRMTATVAGPSNSSSPSSSQRWNSLDSLNFRLWKSVGGGFGIYIFRTYHKLALETLLCANLVCETFSDSVCRFLLNVSICSFLFGLRTAQA